MFLRKEEIAGRSRFLKLSQLRVHHEGDVLPPRRGAGVRAPPSGAGVPLQHVTLPPPNSWLCRVHVGELEARPRLPSWAALLETPPVLSGDLPAWRFLSRPESPWTWSISLGSIRELEGDGKAGVAG